MEPMTLVESFGQKRGEEYEATPSTCSSYARQHAISIVRFYRMLGLHTSFKAISTLFSLSPKSKLSTRPVSMTRGTTLATMSTAIKREAMGSNPVHP